MHLVGSKMQHNGNNILHHFIDYIGQSDCDPGSLGRIKFVVRIILRHYPHLVDDGLVDGRSPLDEAVSTDNCIGIIQAICKILGKNEVVTEDSDVDSSSTTAGSSVPGSPSLALDTKLDPIQTARADNPAQASSTKERHQDRNWPSWRRLAIANRDTCLHKAIKRKKHVYVNYLLEQIEAADAVEVILGHLGQDGLLPLHLAVDFAQCYDSPLAIVEKLIELYPKALTWKARQHLQGGISIISDKSLTEQERVENKTFSPYQYYVGTREQVLGTGDRRAPCQDNTTETTDLHSLEEDKYGE